MNTPAEQQWIEIRNENGQLYYFNKIVRFIGLTFRRLESLFKISP